MTLLLPGSASLSFLTQPPVDFSRKRRKDVEAVDGKGRAALEVQWSLALNDIPLDALHEAMDDVSEVQVVHRRALSGLPRPLTLCSSLCRLVCMTVGQSLRLVLLFEEVVHVKPLLVLEISGPVIQTGLEEEEDVQSGESFPFRILVLCEQRMNVYMCSLLDVESSVRVTCSLARTLTWCACGSRFAPLPSVSSPFVVIAGGHLHVWPPVVRDDAAPATLPTSPIPLTLPDADTTLTLLSCGFGSQPNVLFVTDNQRLMCIRANRVESSAIRVLLTVPTDLPSDHLFESERIIDMAISTKRVQGNVADLIAVSTTSRLLLYDTLSGFRAPLCVWNHMPSLTLLHWCVASPRPDPLNVLLASCGSGEEPMLLIAFTTQATPSDVVSGPSRARLSVAVHTESPLPLLMVPPQLPYWSFSDGALLFPCLTRSRIVAAVASWSTGELSYSELDGLSDGECTVVECPHVPPTELTVPSGGHAAPLVDWEGLATSLTSSLYQGISDSSLPLPVALPAITAVSAARNDIAVGSSTHFRVGPPVRVHAPTGWHTPGLLMDAGTFGGSLPHRKVTGKAPKPELRAPLFTAAPYLEVLDLSPAFVGAGDALAELAGVDCGEVDVEHPAFHESELLVWMPAVMDALTTPHTLQQLCVLLEAFTNRVLDATAALQVMQQYCDRHPGSVLLYSVQLPSLPACEVSCTCAGLSIPSLNDVRPCRAVGCLMPHRLLFCAASALTAILSAGAQDAICSPSFIGRVKFKQVLLMTKRHKSPPPPTPSVKNMAGPEPESAQPGTQASQQPESSGMSFLDELMFLSQTQDSALLEGLPEQATVPVVGDKDPTVEPAHKETTGSDDDNADADIAIDDDGQGLPPRSRAAMKDVDRGEAVLTSDLLADVLQEWPDD